MHRALRRRSAALAWLLVAAAVATACGRKGPVRPPEDVAPRRITDLQGKSAPGGILLSWSRPRSYADGSRMTDLSGFRIERASAGAFVRLATVPVTDQERFRQQSGFQYLDRTTTVGTAYRYRVVSFTSDGYVSAPSNEAAVERRDDREEPHAPLPGTQR